MIATPTSRFTTHTSDTAPAQASEVLRKVEERYGFIPNLAAILAEAPTVLESVLTLTMLFDKVSLDPQQRQVVLLAASASNGCSYCTTVHSGLARQSGVDPETVYGASNCSEVADPQVEALRAFTVAVVEGRGRPTLDQIDGFLAAGFNKAQLFEVLLGVALKTLTNYSGIIADAVPNPEFVAMAG